MPQTLFDSVLSAGVGVIAVLLGTVSVGDPFFGLAVGVSVTVSASLMLRIYRRFPERLTGDSWEDKRWTALSVGVGHLAALFGLVNTYAPEGATALVMLTGLVGYLGGSLAEMERAETIRAELSATDSADD